MASAAFVGGAFGFCLILYTRGVQKQRLLFRPFEHMAAIGFFGYANYQNTMWSRRQKQRLLAELEALRMNTYAVEQQLKGEL